jgi:hypothetical protein
MDALHEAPKRLVQATRHVIPIWQDIWACVNTHLQINSILLLRWYEPESSVERTSSSSIVLSKLTLLEALTCPTKLVVEMLYIGTMEPAKHNARPRVSASVPLEKRDRKFWSSGNWFCVYVK